MIPHDVCTRWNATYDMLDFAYEYKKAINKITDIRDMKLRAYEIELHEWKLVRQLRDILKVSKPPVLCNISAQLFTDFQGCYPFFLIWQHPQHHNSHTYDGPS
jgi:hypothetical protein